ncbi:MAG: hypothetical protein HN453_07490, partial [Gammaproteobacteria bacterium]|nr:hypothetical protein [Gammaproteobacteria bacterium]
MRNSIVSVFAFTVLACSYANAEISDATDAEMEEVVVVGSQIKGAKITGALPVSVISLADIEATGVDSGDDLLEYVAEQG